MQTPPSKRSFIMQTPPTKRSCIKNDQVSHILCKRKSFSVLTWNIWFDDRSIIRRTQFIINQVKKLKPDVLCFQEVVPQTAELLKLQLGTDYDFNKNSVDPYGCLIFSLKDHFAVFHETKMHSNMGRCLITASINFTAWDDLTNTKSINRSICICTSHFESLNFHSIREEQLAVANNNMKDFDNAILCGDFNFCSYWNFNTMQSRGVSDAKAGLENDSLSVFLPEYDDLWPLLVCPEPAEEAGESPQDATDSVDASVSPRLIEKVKGFTFDSTINTMLTSYEQMRYDRVLMKRNCDIKAVEIGLLGTEQIGCDSLGDLFPSDHFGLLAHFIVS